MITHPAFQTDVWAIRESAFTPDILPQSETMFSVSNGYLGLRGNLDEGTPAFEHGTYLNGFYETRPIIYPEGAYGYAQNHQTMLNVTDGKIIRLDVGGETFDVRHGSMGHHERVLDLRRGLSIRRCEWASPRGTRVRIQSTRLVSFEHRHLAAVEYVVEVLDEPSRLRISSEMAANESDQVNTTDPRESAALYGQVLLPVLADAHDERVILGHTVRNSELTVVAGVDHVVDTDAHYTTSAKHTDADGRVVFSVDAKPGEPFRITKYLAYHSGRHDPSTLHHHVKSTLDEGRRRDFETLAHAQRHYLDSFWDGCDVVVEGDDSTQQAIRFAQFQILQAGARAEGTGIPAKGLTGQGYEGHYFWDMETYVLSVLSYTSPKLAERVLRFRHSTLDAARKRAAEVNQEGALFPWRTINGDEASAFFPAGTAEYHIDADIANAVRTYLDASQDETFLAEAGAEILVETARMWASLGFFADRRDGKFCIHGVTGPDEYTAIVDNNTYTNVMAAANLAFAAQVTEQLEKKDRATYDVLVARTGLQRHEPATWKRAAEEIYLPFDDALGIHGQDDSFLDKEPWDLAGTPRDQFPLLLHFHPLVIYRKQVVKQADLVMAMFLQGDRFTPEQKRANFDYYDPLTTGDSSLSACIQAVVAAEVGQIEHAFEYTIKSARMDLDNVEHNVRDGIHVAAMAGTWISLVNGFAGMRARGGNLGFAPQLPAQWTRLKFSLAYRGRALVVDITPPQTTYTVAEGPDLEVSHWDRKLTLPESKPVTVVTPPPPDRGAPG